MSEAQQKVLGALPRLIVLGVILGAVLGVIVLRIPVWWDYIHHAQDWQPCTPELCEGRP